MYSILPQAYLETFEERPILAKYKEGDNFNHRNTLSISRIALSVSAYASLRVTSCRNLSMTQ